ncbi:MAG: hypothetical protein K6E87_05875 [bacterium]|nr:hypothetical protein [bacterium]
MILDEIKYLMEYATEITKKIGDVIDKADYYIEDMGCPHKQPKKLPNGYAAVYIFIYEKTNEYEFLKIGKVNPNSSARFVSQHYGFEAPSTLAKSICFDKEFQDMGIAPNNVKEWMLNNLHRINVYIKASCGMKATELIESLMHYKFNPRFEGNINSKKPIKVVPKTVVEKQPKKSGVGLTQRVRDYISSCKKMALLEGKTEIILVAGEIEEELGVLQRTPAICNAMYDSMNSNDEVLFAPPSGKSTTVKIKYYLK